MPNASETVNSPPTTQVPSGSPTLDSLQAQGIQDACLHCGLCLPACPTYQTTGLETLSPRGRLFLMKDVTQGILPLETIRPSLESCLGCLSCQSVCPAGVPYEAWLTTFKQALTQSPSGSMPKRGLRFRWQSWCHHIPGFLMARLLQNARLLFGLGLLGDRVLNFFSACMPWVLKTKAYQALRGVVPQAPKRFQPQETLVVQGHASPRVWLWRGCVMDAWMGEVHEATQTLWHALTPHKLHPTQSGHCCGALLFHQGDWLAAWHQIRHTLHTTGKSLAEHPNALLLTNAHGCGHMVQHYPQVLQQLAPVLSQQYGITITQEEYHWAEVMAQATHDWHQQLAINLAVPAVALEEVSEPPARRHALVSEAFVHHVVLDSACHGAFGQCITPALQQEAFLTIVRALRTHVSGFQKAEGDDSLPRVVCHPIPANLACCGSAGSYSLKHPQMAQHLGISRLESYRVLTQLPSEAQPALLSNNPGCLMHLGSLARQQEKPYQVHHLAVWLAATFLKRALPKK